LTAALRVIFSHLREKITKGRSSRENNQKKPWKNKD